MEKREADGLTIVELAALMSHDLKQPARQVRQWSEVVAELLEGHLSSLPPGVAQKVSDGLSRVSRGATSLHRMIDGLMDLARLLSAPLESTGDPAATLSQAVDDMAEAGQWSSRVKLARYYGPDGMPLVKLSDSGLMALWKNLLSNAIKFSDPEKVLNIAVGLGTVTVDGVTIYISDDGKGIAEVDQPRIFDLFAKLDPESDGSGFGLALCQMILERVGGSLALVGSKPGDGSIFKLQIPLASEPQEVTS